MLNHCLVDIVYCTAQRSLTWMQSCFERWTVKWWPQEMFHINRDRAILHIDNKKFSCRKRTPERALKLFKVKLRIWLMGTQIEFQIHQIIIVPNPTYLFIYWIDHLMQYRCCCRPNIYSVVLKECTSKDSNKFSDILQPFGYSKEKIMPCFPFKPV